MKRRVSRNILLLALLIIAVAATILCAFFGMKTITPQSLFSGSFDGHIFWQLRLPRVLVAFLAGSGLALCGMRLPIPLR
jgi:ABC-type cobalamin transport system permease subunit